MTADSPSSSSQAPAAPSLPVLHVADYDVFDRFGQMLRHVALALGAEGVRVGLLTDDPAAVADLEGTPVECYWSRFLSGWLAWRDRRQWSRRLAWRPALVHLWGARALRTVGAWAARAGIPMLVHVLSVADVERVCRGSPRRPCHVLAGCAGLSKLVATRAPQLAARAAVCHPALLMPDVGVEPADVANRTLSVLWVGRFGAGAGLETLIEAVAHLRRKQCDLQAALVGAGSATRATQAQVRAARVQDCVSLINEPDLWEKAVAGADVCVVPARQEELWLAPLLAMALGKVVVASRDQPAEWFVEDQTCWQFTPGSAVELAYHLARVTTASRHAAALRQSAAAYVREHHAIGGLVRDLLAAYAHTIDAQVAARGS